MRKKCPILVASLDRVSRNTAAIESFMTKTPVKIVVANLDAEANEIIIRSEVKKAQVIAEHISETTRASLQALKKSGVKLGNKTNLKEAQAKGVFTNRILAIGRHSDFEMALNRAREGGAVTAKEIASSLNAMKFPTARGGEWTPENVYRQLNKQKMKNEAPVAPECSLPSPAPAFANPDGVLTPEGVKRVRAAMAANKLKWEISGKPMSATGRNRLDASIIPGLRGEAPLDGEFLVSLEKWVVAKEDEAAASKER